MQLILGLAAIAALTACIEAKGGWAALSQAAKNAKKLEKALEKANAKTCKRI